MKQSQAETSLIVELIGGHGTQEEDHTPALLALESNNADNMVIDTRNRFINF